MYDSQPCGHDGRAGCADRFVLVGRVIIGISVAVGKGLNVFVGRAVFGGGAVGMNVAVSVTRNLVAISGAEVDVLTGSLTSLLYPRQPTSNANEATTTKEEQKRGSMGHTLSQIPL